MKEIAICDMRLRRASVVLEESASPPGGIDRQNSYALESFSDRGAQVKVLDRIRGQVNKDHAVVFDCELIIELSFQDPVPKENFDKFVVSTLDQPALSLSNTVFGVLSAFMELAPIVLPPVWQSQMEALRKKANPTRAKEKG